MSRNTITITGASDEFKDELCEHIKEIIDDPEIPIPDGISAEPEPPEDTTDYIPSEKEMFHKPWFTGVIFFPLLFGLNLCSPTEPKPVHEFRLQGFSVDCSAYNAPGTYEADYCSNLFERGSGRVK